MSSPVVTTTAGPVRGKVTTEGIAIFRGIPYAASTAGPGRWQPPAAPEPWSDVRESTRPGPMAPQNPSQMESAWGASSLPSSEDCLSLAVYTPGIDDARRPVMVWIHGGGFTGGTAATPWYDGRRLATRGDVVVVGINYRLGALGFSELSGVGGEALAHAGNVGILDQVAALRWVRDNIASFGGDPGNVTIFGESAGAMSVGTLLGLPAAAGLFHKAILQSGAAHNWSTRDHARSIAGQLVEEASGGDLDALRAADVATILSAQAALERRRPGMGLPFQPVVDGVDLPRPPLDAIAAGSVADVPVLIGTNADEMNLFALMDTALADIDADGLGRRLDAAGLGDATANVLDVYRATAPDAAPRELWLDIMTDWVFRIPAIRLLEAQVAHRRAWAYLFTARSTSFDGVLGSCHALEIPFVFGTLDRPGISLFTGDIPGGEELSIAMQEAWLAFARTGDPNHAGLPDWPAYETSDRATMELGTERRLLLDPAAERRAVWDGVR